MKTCEETNLEGESRETNVDCERRSPSSLFAGDNSNRAAFGEHLRIEANRQEKKLAWEGAAQVRKAVLFYFGLVLIASLFGLGVCMIFLATDPQLKACAFIALSSMVAYIVRYIVRSMEKVD